MPLGEASPSQIKKWKKQRAERGFSDYDVYDIDIWFLTIMPKMLDELIKHINSYPSSFEDEYIKEHKLDHLNLSDEQREQMDKYCFNKWKKILREMKSAFIKSNDHSYIYKNKYEEEYNRLWKPFFETYGFNGEALKGNVKKEYLRDKKGKIIETLYHPIKTYRFKDMSEENKRISKLHFAENRKIEKRYEANKRKALEMFVKYFDQLWW